MLRIFIVALCILGLAPAVADDALPPCRSISDVECGPLPRVSVMQGVRVERVTARKRTVSYPLKGLGSETDDYTQSCPGGTCACDEDVEYLSFKGGAAGLRIISAREKRAASLANCSIDNSTVWREPQHVAVSATLVSISTFDLEYCQTCGGSCHCHTILSTYDIRSGKALRIGDVLKPGSVDALRRQLVDDFVLKNFDEGDRARERAQFAQEFSARPLVDEGFYVENGTVYANMDSFALSCAAGSFFPVAVAAGLIDPSFAALIRGAPR